MKKGHYYSIDTENGHWSRAMCASVNGHEATIHWTVEGKIKREKIDLRRSRFNHLS